MVSLRYVYGSRPRSSSSSSSPEWSATAIPLSTPQLDFPPTRFLLHVSHPVYAIVDATRVHGYCLLKFDLGGFVNCAVSCFRAYFEFEEILHLKSIDFRYIHDSRGTKSCILSFFSFFFYFVVERFRNCGRRENSCLYTYNLKSRKNH